MSVVRSANSGALRRNERVVFLELSLRIETALRYIPIFRDSLKKNNFLNPERSFRWSLFQDLENYFFCSSGFLLQSGLIQSVILSPFYLKELALQNQFAPAFSIAFQHRLPLNKSFYRHSNTYPKAFLVLQ